MKRLLLIFPPAYRARFGDDLLDHMRDARRAAAGRGHLALATFWLQLVRDLVSSGLAERWSAPRHHAQGDPMNGFVQDVRYALRLMARRPALSLVIVVTLALGIGANTAIFSLVDTVLLRPLPYREPQRLVMVWEQLVQRGDPILPVRPANFFDWKTRVTSLEDIAWSRDGMFNITGEGQPETVIGYRYSANMFAVLGVEPALGRTFRADEDRAGGPSVVVLSHTLWQRRYAGRADVLGRSVTLNGTAYTIVGVMPPSFSHPQGTELWTPIALDPALAARRDVTALRLVARLKPGTTSERLQAELDAIYGQLARDFPTTNTGLTPNVVRLDYAGDARPLLAALFGGVGFVLLIACANVANLLLADASSRRRELAVRTALGASRSRVVRQMLTESVLLSLAGGALGATITWWMSDALVTLFPRNISNLDLPLVERVDMTATVFAFALAVSVATGLLFGLLPAWNVARGNLQAALKEGERGAAAGRRTHATLVVAEVALSIVLLAGALLMVQSFQRLQQGRLGFEAERVLTARLTLPPYRYPTADHRRAFTTMVIDRLNQIPSVESAGVTNYLPLSGWWGTISFRIDGHPEPKPGEVPSADDRRASEGYFQTMGISLRAGRLFTARDDATAPRVALVNEALARKYFGSENPVGRRLSVDGARPPLSLEIVGVISDVRSFGLEEDVHAELFRPVLQAPSTLLAVALRTQVDPASIAAPLRAAVWAIDRDQPITHLLPMRDLAAESLAFRRVGMLLAGGFGLLALVLAAIGLYGVLSYAVTKRRREIGVRIALGATRREIMSLVVRQGLTLTGIGLAIGLTAAVPLMRVLTAVLFEVRPDNPAAYAAAAATLVGVSLVACGLPAYRAMKVDPITALRME